MTLPGHFRLISLPGYHAVQFPGENRHTLHIGPAETLQPDTATLRHYNTMTGPQELITIITEQSTTIRLSSLNP